MTGACRSEQCREAVRFISDDLCKKPRDTLTIVGSNVFSWKGLAPFSRRFITKNMNLFSDFIFVTEINQAIWDGYRLALRGSFRSAEENNRFIIERVCLSVFIQTGIPDYLDVLRKRAWHKMVDDGYTVLNFGEALSRVRRLTHNDLKRVSGDYVWFMGRPVCGKHLKYRDFSRSLKDLLPHHDSPRGENRRNKVDLGNLKCFICGKRAEYLTLVMPKVSALIGLACSALSLQPDSLYRTYSSLSRVIHPYGFTRIGREESLLLWLRDYFMIVSVVKEAQGRLREFTRVKRDI